MSVLLILNNYFHDLFTGLLVAAGFLMRASQQIYHLRSEPLTTGFYLALYRSYARLAKVALAGVLLCGIPRILAFKTYEFIPAVTKGLVVALGVKHVLLFGAVGLGLYWWYGLSREVAQLVRTGGVES